MRIVFVQHGDYRDAAKRFAVGGDETNYGQRYTVGVVAYLAKNHEYVSVICMDCPPYPMERLSNDVYVSGMPLWRGATMQELIAQVEREEPTHLIVRSPLTKLFQHAAKRHYATLPFFADSFDFRTLRNRYRYYWLARVLNKPCFPWVANHGINACRSLQRIGVNAEKIMPYDQKPSVTPDQFSVKDGPSDDGRIRLFYAGAVTVGKGVKDCLDALEILRKEGKDASLTLAGVDADGQMEAYAKERGLADAVTFLGKINQSDVVNHMHRSDAVLVATRYEYPEGLPRTIYETYVSRTPLIASDHPMFAGNVVDGESGLVFKSGNPRNLAEKTIQLMSDRALYRRLSEASKRAWERLHVSGEFGEIIRHFVEGTDINAEWARQYMLTSPAYANWK